MLTRGTRFGKEYIVEKECRKALGIMGVASMDKGVREEMLERYVTWNLERKGFETSKEEVNETIKELVALSELETEDLRFVTRR